MSTKKLLSQLSDAEKAVKSDKERQNMRINKGTIGKLGDESTRLKIIEMSKDNPNLLKQYESFVAMMSCDSNHKINKNTKII